MTLLQAVVRALRVFRSLAAAQQGLTLQELSNELHIPVGSMHRLLGVLSKEGFIGRSPSNRRYFLGPAALELAELSRDSNPMLNLGHPALSAAAEQSGETVFATQLIGDRAICIHLVEARHPLRLFVRIGQEMPLHAAASARAVLADLDDAHIERLLSSRKLRSYTDGTPTTIEEVMRHVSLVRERGYDTCADELDADVWAVAAPVRTATGRVCASVTLAAPVSRLATSAARKAALRLVLRTAAAMSSDFGFNGDRLHGPRSGAARTRLVED